MSAQSVRAWIAANAPDLEIIEVEESTATVATAAAALKVEPGQIAKTLAVRVGDHVFLLVTRGDARLDNRKSKAEFGARPRMLGHDLGPHIAVATNIFLFVAFFDVHQEGNAIHSCCFLVDDYFYYDCMNVLVNLAV